MRLTFYILLGLFMGAVSDLNSQIKIVTYNIRYANSTDGLNDWEHRSAEISKQISDFNADFIGLQEALYLQIKMVQNKLGSLYEHIGVGRDFGDSIGEHCPLFYRSDIYQRVNHNALTTFWLSETETVPSKSWDAALPRIATGDLFENRLTKNQIYVLNTHFDHIGNEARINSMKLIYNKLKPYLDSGIAVVLLGDFNLQPDSKPIQWISTKLSDCRNSSLHAQMNGEGTKHTFNGFKLTPTGPIIDYVFTSSNLYTDYYEVDHHMRGEGLFYSDHYPVLVKLERLLDSGKH